MHYKQAVIGPGLNQAETVVSQKNFGQKPFLVQKKNVGHKII